MYRGTIDGFSGSWGSGLGSLIINGQLVPCDNAATVRALEACFGGVITPGNTVSQDSIVGREIRYSVSPWGVLEGFSPVDDNIPEDEKEEQGELR
jgi:hypothetical protein